ncbi:MAG: molybdate ABC transporter permease subunit [Desulfovibrio sp.]
MDITNLDYFSLLVTLKLAGIVTPILLLLCLPLSYWLATSNASWRQYVEAACNLPMVLPPTVLGFGLLMLMSPISPVGELWFAITGSNLTFTFTGLVIGSLIYSLPFGILPMRTAFEKIDKGIIEAARCLGMTHFQTFIHVILPNAIGGITASTALIFAHTVGEFGIALMIGGSIPGETKVTSIAIFEHTESLEYGSAAMLSIILMLISYCALVFISNHNKPQKKRITISPKRHPKPCTSKKERVSHGTC